MKSTRMMLLLGLFVFAVVWIMLMGLVAYAGAKIRGGGGTDPVENGTKAVLTNVERADDFTITLSLGITDAEGKVVGGLEEKDIDVYEDGELVLSYKDFIAAGKAPVRIGLVMDYSASMRGQKLQNAHVASEALLLMLGDPDFGGVFMFNDNLLDQKAFERVPVAQFTRPHLVRCLKSIWNTGLGNGSPMLLSMDKALDGLKTIKGRRVLIVLSDGLDTGEPDEVARYTETVVAKSLDMKVPLYMINTSSDPDPMSKAADEKGLKDLADRTNGKYFAVPNITQLKEIFESIGKSLQNEYTLSYDSLNTVLDGVPRQLKVVVRNGNGGTKTTGDYKVPGLVSAGEGARRGGSGGTVSGTGLGTVFMVCLVLGGLLALAFAVPNLMRTVQSGQGDFAPVESGGAKPAAGKSAPMISAKPQPKRPK